MEKGELYQIYQQIQSADKDNTDSEAVLTLFEIYNDTTFWVEVQGSSTSKISMGFNKAEGWDGPLLFGYIAEPDSEFPPENVQKLKSDEKNIFRKFTGFELMYMRTSASIPFNLMVVENEKEMFPISSEMYDAYAVYLMNKHSSKKEDTDTNKAISTKSKLVEKSGHTMLYSLVFVVIIILAILLFFI